MSEAPRWALPLLVSSQLMCCSTWFAANAVLQELLARNGDSGYSSPEVLARSISVATALVQAGFIFGTLVVAGFSLADRYPPHAIFAVSALAAALSNVLPVISTSVGVLFASRAAAGVALAGVYPVGMRIAARLFPKGLGTSLGWLVGALVVGTAVPHMLRALADASAAKTSVVDARVVLGVTSAFAAASGVTTWAALTWHESRAKPRYPAETFSGPSVDSCRREGRLSELASQTRDSRDAGELTVHAAGEYESSGASLSTRNTATATLAADHSNRETVNAIGTAPLVAFSAVPDFSPLSDSVKSDSALPQSPRFVQEVPESLSESASAGSPNTSPRRNRSTSVALAGVAPPASRCCLPFQGVDVPSAFVPAALGYFGHMWEVYTLWALVPLMLAEHVAACREAAAQVPVLSWAAASCFSLPLAPEEDAGWVAAWAFVIIAAGAVGCVGGGYVATAPCTGSARTAAALLATSGLCCALAPALLIHGALPTPALLTYLVLWSIAAAGDSPQFSALVAANAPPGRVGAALALVTALGFSVSAASLALMGNVPLRLPWRLMLLAPGPALGVYSMARGHLLWSHLPAA